jgi:DNA ligase (NAD+)
MKDDIIQQVERLRKEINWHNYCYYVLDQPEVSDYTYDMQMRELMNLEDAYDLVTPSSPTQTVGYNPELGIPEGKSL